LQQATFQDGFCVGWLLFLPLAKDFTEWYHNSQGVRREAVLTPRRGVIWRYTLLALHEEACTQIAPEAAS
jgi:hypothetical protein